MAGADAGGGAHVPRRRPPTRALPRRPRHLRQYRQAPCLFSFCCSCSCSCSCCCCCCCCCCCYSSGVVGRRDDADCGPAKANGFITKHMNPQFFAGCESVIYIGPLGSAATLIGNPQNLVMWNGCFLYFYFYFYYFIYIFFVGWAARRR